jgi:tRNA modification GTPase
MKNIDVLKNKLLSLFDARIVNTTDTIVTNARHSDSLKRAGEALKKVAKGLEEQIAGDLLALEIRYALNELGSITGEVSTDDLLDSIFTKFCIGK